MKSVRIDVVSDIVCPWCLIGTSRLERALEELPEVQAEITYHPFLLDPSTPPEGVDLRESLRRKYGDPEPLFRRVEQAARDAGVEIDFEKVRRSVPTVRAHTLLRHAIGKGTQRALARDLFTAHFTAGRDVSAFDVLVDLGVGRGFTKEEVIALLEDPAELAATRVEARAASARGISGVPYTIIADTYAISGAQPPEVFRQAIEKVM